MSTSRNLSLKCGVCGSENFEYDEKKFTSIDEAEEVICVNCKKVYTSEELIEINSVFIENTAEEIAEEEIIKMLKKSGFKIK